MLMDSRSVSEGKNRIHVDRERVVVLLHRWLEQSCGRVIHSMLLLVLSLQLDVLPEHALVHLLPLTGLQLVLWASFHRWEAVLDEDSRVSGAEERLVQPVMLVIVRQRTIVAI